MSGLGRSYDVIVIGAGLAGLTAALALAGSGLRLAVMGRGGGYLHFTSGCVDVLGRDFDGESVADPLAAIDDFRARRPDHPYALAGTAALIAGVQLFRDTLRSAGVEYVGDLRRTIDLPTALGSIRTTCLCPRGMAAGDVGDRTPMLIAGFRDFRDFSPPYLAANLSRLTGMTVRALVLDTPGPGGRHHLLPTDLARLLDDAGPREEIGGMIRGSRGEAGRVGLPAVLGLVRHAGAREHLEDLVGCPVFEIPTLPPSVSGIRIERALRRALLAAGARLEIGFPLQGRVDGHRAVSVEVQSAGRPTIYRAEAFILATGGTGGGGILTRPDGTAVEGVFGLPVDAPASRRAWYREIFLGHESQPIGLAGVRTNARLQPLTASGYPVENVFVVGSTLPAWDPVRDGSGEGVALATAWKAASEVRALLGEGVAASSPPMRSHAGG